MYFDRQKALEHDLTKVDVILLHAKRVGGIIAMDSNAWSTTWHDTTSNRGKHLEEYIISKHLHIMNELSANSNFESRTGKSNIDLTLVTSNVLRRIPDWKISDEESNSDHNIINYDKKKCQEPLHKTDGTEIHDERGRHGKIPRKCMQNSGGNNPAT
jgi:hypothetical protein